MFNSQIKKNNVFIIFSEINDSMPISETNRRKIDFLCHFDTTCHTKQPLFIYNICQNRIGKIFVVNKNRKTEKKELNHEQYREGNSRREYQRKG